MRTRRPGGTGAHKPAALLHGPLPVTACPAAPPPAPPSTHSQPTPSILAQFGFLAVFIKAPGAHRDALGAAGGVAAVTNLCSTAKLSQRLKFPTGPVFSSKSTRTFPSTVQPNLAQQILSKNTASLRLTLSVSTHERPEKLNRQILKLSLFKSEGLLSA